MWAFFRPHWHELGFGLRLRVCFVASASTYVIFCSQNRNVSNSVTSCWRRTDCKVDEMPGRNRCIPARLSQIRAAKCASMVNQCGSRTLLVPPLKDPIHSQPRVEVAKAKRALQIGESGAPTAGVVRGCFSRVLLILFLVIALSAYQSANELTDRLIRPVTTSQRSSDAVIG